MGNWQHQILLVLWLAICAIQDYRTGEVSNWLTLPAFALALVARLAGWLISSPLGVAPWWMVGLVWALSLYLWHSGRIGGADAKAWMAFSLLGNGVLWSAYFGLMIWYVAMQWSFAYCGHEERRHFPGFPGYLLGVGGAALILTGRRLFHIIPDVAFILYGYFL
ncbi:MAG: prepilin peptidase [Anaerolineales bacterium]|nr:prepilin peptidase [Anaerolineales bacterium]